MKNAYIKSNEKDEEEKGGEGGKAMSRFSLLVHFLNESLDLLFLLVDYSYNRRIHTLDRKLFCIFLLLPPPHFTFLLFHFLQEQND